MNLLSKLYFWKGFVYVITSKHIMFFIRISIIGNFQPAGLKPTELDV